MAQYLPCHFPPLARTAALVVFRPSIGGHGSEDVLSFAFQLLQDASPQVFDKLLTRGQTPSKSGASFPYKNPKLLHQKENTIEY